MLFLLKGFEGLAGGQSDTGIAFLFSLIFMFSLRVRVIFYLFIFKKEKKKGGGGGGLGLGWGGLCKEIGVVAGPALVECPRRSRPWWSVPGGLDLGGVSQCPTFPSGWTPVLLFLDTDEPCIAYMYAELQPC